MLLDVRKRFVGYPEKRRFHIDTDPDKRPLRLELTSCPGVPGELFEVALQGAVQAEIEKRHWYKLQGYVPYLVNRIHQHVAYCCYLLARFIARDVNSLS